MVGWWASGGGFKHGLNPKKIAHATVLLLLMVCMGWVPLFSERHAFESSLQLCLAQGFGFSVSCSRLCRRCLWQTGWRGAFHVRGDNHGGVRVCVKSCLSFRWLVQLLVMRFRHRFYHVKTIQRCSVRRSSQVVMSHCRVNHILAIEGVCSPVTHRPLRFASVLLPLSQQANGHWVGS